MMLCSESAHPGFSKVFATVLTSHKLLAQILGISGSPGTLQLQELYWECLKFLSGLAASPETPKGCPGRDCAAKRQSECVGLLTPVWWMGEVKDGR